MRFRGWRFILAIGVAVSAFAAGGEPGPEAAPLPAGQAQPQTEGSPAAPVQPSAQELERIKELLPQLDDDTFDRRQAASRALLELGLKAERPLREALAADPSPEARVRLLDLLGILDALKAGIAGDWEETWEGIDQKGNHRIWITAGELNIAPTDYAEHHQQYKFFNVKMKDGEMTFHQITNPGYEFDVRLKIMDKDVLKGEATRRSDGLVLKVEFKRIKERPKTK